MTAGVAAPASAGIPVTHRDLASAVAFVTGHEDPSKTESTLDWAALAAFPGTLVIYMGVRQLEAIAGRLIAGGRSANEPAAVIERGTLPGQRTVTGTLESIASVAAAADVRAPAIAVFGAGRGHAPAAAMGRAPDAARRERRGDPGAGAGERPGRTSTGARRRGGGGADDPDRPHRR